MSVTRSTNKVIVLEDSDEQIQARHTVSRQALSLLDLDHFDHHVRQAEATFSNVCRTLDDLPRAQAMRDRLASSLEAMEARVSDLEDADR